MQSVLTTIIGNAADTTKLCTSIDTFLKQASKTFTFPELNQNNLRSDVWTVLFNCICETPSLALKVQCLSGIRILSRDKRDLDQLITEERLDILLHCAFVEVSYEDSSGNNQNAVILEALKCMCNLVFNSKVAAATSARNGTIEGIITRLKLYKANNIPNDIKLFDMKVLFLITALCDEIVPKIKDACNGVSYFIKILADIVKKCDDNPDLMQESVQNHCLLDIEVDFICEILKVLFNLTIRSTINKVDEEEEAHDKDLVATLRDLLVTETESELKRLELHNHIVNLLTNMPNSCYKALLTPVKDEEAVPKNMQLDEMNMTAVYQLLIFLRTRFADEMTVKTQNELLSPVLTVLVKSVSSDRAIRKYLRLNILPPLRDVHNRPEQGDILRNCLCRLLTTPMTNVRDLSADLLFILCKENVGRMIKYTGYGNAAGLFAKRGLLGGGQPGETDYSSDSEDSDTEEYKEYKHGINPVIGCYEPPHPSPTANMTEEQKEYEAMKLVNLMEDLTRKGIVQPCRIGENGRPEPIAHVMQLQEGLPDQQVHLHN